ncbi:hypothetical protein IT072_02580 [Leifsonia sp. ZF2019]|uniref:hypothetical protein n=1 Tax=Leifsonia sp. ZF2019 TaxID=2781978 RepID=UPI001CBF5230|nr:hypothetical protein [Leifsonia sp. ZF2019]UAJ79983.1 hypothetical protein IT072_02580 [Leifsonia sp. ZF2019]
MSVIDPKDVREALERMKGGDASTEVFAAVVAAAEAYADMQLEWGLASPQATLYYASRNDMLIETMHAGRQQIDLLARVAGDWVIIRPGSGAES